ncbi:hypothetical protein CPB86DRAFT_763071 [Serendipita vermifera]|nr:hypothetical protein CPB86DRAFT_763071 [Serendipita vermifera]
MGGFLVILVFAGIAGLSFASWFAAPKGPQQTLIRTMLILSLWCCFIMWSITYMAQLHPLIAPRRNDLRFEEEDDLKRVLL